MERIDALEGVAELTLKGLNALLQLLKFLLPGVVGVGLGEELLAKVVIVAAGLAFGVAGKGVKGVGWGVKSCQQLAVLLGNVKAVEAIEVGEGVLPAEKKVLPVVMVGLGATGGSGFDDDDPGAKQTEAGALQYLGFCAFDVDFEEVDVFACSMPGKQCVQRQYWHGQCIDLATGTLVTLGNSAIEGGEASVWDVVQGERAVLIGYGALDVDIARAVGLEFVKPVGHGFDVDAAPALVVEPPGDGVDGGIVGTDVHVKASAHVPEGAPEHDILEILCVGDKGHGRVMSRDGGSQLLPSK